MGKLGKKARKFAKKNLQSVLKRKRKLKSLFKKKSSDKRSEGNAAEDDSERDRNLALSNGRDVQDDDMGITPLDAVFGEDDIDLGADDSGSDGYLSVDLEDESCRFVDESKRSCIEDMDGDNALSAESREILSQLEKEREKLQKLKQKDAEFSKFLESNNKHLKALRDEEGLYSDDEIIDDGNHSLDETDGTMRGIKLLSHSAVESLYRLIKEQQNVAAFVRLVNFYRAACHYGAETARGLAEDNGALSNILMFMLHEADNIFRKMLGVSCFNERKETVSELKNSSNWKTLQPFVKCYLRSTLYLLNEATDPEILAFILARLRFSVIYFAAFPSLLQRLIKISVHFWVTGRGTLSQHSFLIIRDVTFKFSTEWSDTCMIKASKAIIDHCQFVEPALFKHIQFLKNSFVELCARDVQKSYGKAFASVQQLAKILRLAMKTKKKEVVKKLCSWQYANCIDLWVAFVSVNVHDYDLQPLLYLMIHVVNGVAVLFPGPRYFPLRVKCVQWLNHLSSSSGLFIPIVSLALDILEYKIGKEGRKPGKEFSFSSSIKLPKHWLKSQNFQEECVFSAIELLATHFAQWSYHISFPELATIPLICLRKFQEMSTSENSRRVVKQFIDQVEQNVEFVRKRRDDVAFSPKDEQSVDTFLQLEKCNGNTPFMQYYRSILEKASFRNLLMNEKLSSLKQATSKRKRQKLPKTKIDVGVQGQGGVSERAQDGMKRRKKGEEKEG